ncbi:ribosomal-protein-alanine acetyltransferase [Moraxella macacae 0408225]|uniref:[Ribosomal protein bS18]-alanine N-acetyltransferase n=1 Tax=Moraxella macacae 0408225 TaxID=1230338 RepID=L2FAZ2_9GAMM|nr:ribosomal protein S18-alanine N-acetyltransferase [Moraxella macacae]ELA09603.1 ribosomal-protein-alanine acetyltransferase [Moraxella macacae 0408225]
MSKFLQKNDIDDNWLQQIAKIEQSLFVDAWSQTVISDLLNHDNHQLLVLCVGDVVMGYCLYSQMFDTAEILRLATRLDCQRQGIASQLLTQVFDKLNLVKVENLLLEVREDNLAAIGFYQQFGFRQIATRKNYYQNADNSRTDALILQRLF